MQLGRRFADEDRGLESRSLHARAGSPLALDGLRARIAARSHAEWRVPVGEGDRLLAAVRGHRELEVQLELLDPDGWMLAAARLRAGNPAAAAGTHADRGGNHLVRVVNLDDREATVEVDVRVTCRPTQPGWNGALLRIARAGARALRR